MTGFVDAAIADNAFHVGLVATAFGFGLRHGVDWDHIAALTDITSSQSTRRRSMVLSTFYILGHALVVLILGVGAIAIGARLPEGVDVVMERIVGVTLILLAVYVFWGLAKHGRDFRMRSRWMLVFAGTRRALHRLRRTGRSSEVVFEHDHEHPADEPHAAGAHHVHDEVLAGASNRSPRSIADSHLHRHPHRHSHRHQGTLPADPFVDYGNATSFGVGVLHGVGAETPTQVVIFLTIAGVQGTGAGLLLLGCFLAGLLVSNSLIAVAATLGFAGAANRWWLYASVSVVTAVFSLVVGALLLLGNGSLLPAIFSG